MYIVDTRDRRNFYITGHYEYDPLTLKGEYDRDTLKGIAIQPPNNYFPGNDPLQFPQVLWRGHAHLLFSNWMNYYVYQATPYNLEAIPEGFGEG